MASERTKVLGIAMKAVDRMSPAMKAARFAIRAFKRTTLAAFRAMRSAAKLVGRAFKAMLGPIGLVTAALGGFGLLKLVRVATDVEDRAREIATLLPKLGAEAIAQLSRDIRAAAVEGGQAFQDEFKAAYDAISAGVAPAQLIEFMRTANTLAVAGATDVGTAVDLLTGTINAFGASASEARRFSDAMFTTVRKGKTTIAELASGIGNVSSIASAAGLSIEETGAAMAALTLSLGSTELAATQLKAALSVLVTVTPQQRKAAAELANGLDLSLRALKQKGIVEFLRDFNEKTQGSLEVMARIIPNIRAISGLTILAADGGRQFADSMAAMRDNVGAADKAFSIMAESAGFAFRQLRAAVADIATEIGGAFLPLLSELADSMRGFLAENRDNFRRWAEDVVSNIEFAARAIGPLKDLIVSLFTDPAETATLGTVLRDLGDFSLVVVKETAVAGITIVIETIKASFRSFLDVVGILGEQLGARFVSRFRNEIKTLALVGFDIVKGLEDVIGKTATVALAQTRTFSFLQSFLISDEDLAAAKEAIRSGVDELAGVAEEKIVSAETTLGNIIQAIGGEIRTALSEQGKALNVAKDNIGIALDELIAKFEELGVSSPAVAEFRLALAAIRTEMAGIPEDATAAAVGIDGLGAALRRNAKDLKEVAEAAKNVAGTDTAEGGGFFGGIKAGAAEFKTEVVSAFQVGKEAVATFVDVASTGLSSVFASVIDGTKSASDAFKDFARQALQSIGDIIAKLIALKIVSAFFGGSGGGLGSLIGAAKGAVIQGPIQEVQRFAAGGLSNLRGGAGIVSRPALALIGEGRQREAIVPLPDGRAIPAIITDSGDEGPMIVNNFSFSVVNAKGMAEAIQEQAETVRNIIAAGIQQQRDFRAQVRGPRG